MACKISHYDGADTICDELDEPCPFRNPNGRKCAIAIQKEEEKCLKQQVRRDHSKVVSTTCRDKS